MHDLPYHERLVKLILYLLQTRRKRYCIIYGWKVLQGLVPHLLSTHSHPASGGVRQEWWMPFVQRDFLYNSSTAKGGILRNLVPNIITSAISNRRGRSCNRSHVGVGRWALWPIIVLDGILSDFLIIYHSYNCKQYCRPPVPAGTQQLGRWRLSTMSWRALSLSDGQVAN